MQLNHIQNRKEFPAEEKKYKNKSKNKNNKEQK